MSKKLSLTELKQQLIYKSHAELVEEIALLYKKFPLVKEYYQSNLSGDDTEVLNKYRDIIRGEFVMNGNRMPKLRLSVARKAVTDFKKVSSSPYNTADLMLFYVETGVKCMLEFGMDEPFCNSMESMYETALKHIVKEKLFAIFDSRLKGIIRIARGVGWGIDDQMSCLYEDYEAMVAEPVIL